ncbi:MAG TPA: DUF3014 domain-containing protein [Gammaproteobacteria bacterium]|nr:DUF3014 domain-containing protein [Gammaproteobacteria bacterium]
MKQSDFVVAVILGAAIVLAVQYFQPPEPPQPVTDVPDDNAQAPVREAPPPEIRYPLPEPPAQVVPPSPAPVEAGPGAELAGPPAPQQEPLEANEPPAPEHPLPALDDSDDQVRKDLYGLAAKPVLDTLLNLNHIIRRFVVTVDNLPRRQLANSKYRSNQAVPGRFTVEQDDLGIYLGEQNFARYTPFVRLLESLESQRVLAFYAQYYPLVQTAYEELGYPSAYFNDRLIDVIDHLLETPETGGRIALVRPRVLYLYVDPELEGLSAGQKVLIRMGPRNAARVKSKLRELRRALAGN